MSGSSELSDLHSSLFDDLSASDLVDERLTMVRIFLFCDRSSTYMPSCLFLFDLIDIFVPVTSTSTPTPTPNSPTLLPTHLRRASQPSIYTSIKSQA